ncbi:MAG: hydroxymethylglutaryl-CoA lyase [Rhizomicrobium sp.]
MKFEAGKRIFIHEVGPRDGFQAEAVFIPTATKIAIIDRLSKCGLPKIEATSFTSPKAIPALADADTVMAGIERASGTKYVALVPNAKGAERAALARVDEVNVVMSISERHNLSNIHMTREKSVEAIAGICGTLSGSDIGVVVSLSTAFGCALSGAIAQDEVLHWAGRIAHLGIAGFNVCDTIGSANPAQVDKMVHAMEGTFFGLQVSYHFHDTRGMALANVLAAIDAGADRFEATVGGLGGCPYAPGATGNACTEDLANMLSAAGYDTGVDAEKIAMIARDLPAIIGHDLPSHVARVKTLTTSCQLSI